MYLPRQSPGPVSMSPVLTLETVTRREAGSYQCRADNGVGPPQFKKIDLLISCKLLSSLCVFRSIALLSPLLHFKNIHMIFLNENGGAT